MWRKTNYHGHPPKGMLETESKTGVPSPALLETQRKDGANLLEQILHRENLNEAFRKVKQNNGAAGIDGMEIKELLPHLKKHGGKLLTQIYEETYRPSAVRRVEIPKPDGGIRNLGIPTAVDRMIQQAIAQVLTPIFEKTFSDHSYGFRPKRNAHMAIRKAKQYYEEGYTALVDIDLEKYFDTVHHDILIQKLREHVSDERVIRLIRKYLKSGVMMNGVVCETGKGTPQGGNLSPLLSNIYLTAFDRMLESRGHRFVRYADDCNIYVKSRRAAERVMQSCTKYLEKTLKLKVNQEKSKVGSPLRRKFLGFSLYKMKEAVGIRPHSKSIHRLKWKIKALTSRKQAKSIEQILQKLTSYITGWLSYYAIADMRAHMKAINEWTRRRIRQIHWKQWKKISAKFDNLKKLGIPKAKAWEWANSRLGYWRVAGSFILTRSLTNEYLASVGYLDILNKYKALHLTY